MKDIIMRSLLKASLIVSFFLLVLMLFNETQDILYRKHARTEMRARQEKGYSTVTRGGYVNDTIKTQK